MSTALILTYSTVASVFLLFLIPAVVRDIHLRRVRAAMIDFCLAPTPAKEQEVVDLLDRHGVRRSEIGDEELYVRWIDMRLAIGRLGAFRRGER